jgi:peptidyl-prolyl cis-trans isomerase C
MENFMSRYRNIAIFSALLITFGTPFSSADARKAVPKKNYTETSYAAKVNGEIISKRDVDQVFRGNPKLPDNQQNRRAIIDELVARELIIQSAKKKNLDRNDEVMDAINASTRQILFAAGADSYLKENPISDSVIHTQYDNWVKNFPRDEYKVRRILVKTRDEAERITSKIRDGKSFSDLALQSLDTESAKKGGEIGWVTPMLPQTAQQLANLQIGKVSDPLEAPNGWEVVEVMEKRPATPPEFAQVKDRFSAAMQQELLRRYVQDLRDKAQVIIP